ncbi:MAG TPA: DUF1080 domain-containing protein [Burkholderiales bacterium]|nr:DUF1080 domain-containing protein [Burkholderiales bacterium]
MKRLSGVAAALLVIAFTITGCAHGLRDGWVSLIDGEKGLENFDRVGDVNWRAEGGAIVGDKGKGGHLVTKKSYKDFELRAEFYAETTTQSGIFVRISDPRKIGSANAYEANIYDLRPGQEYATAAIVDVARVPVPLIYKAGPPKGGKWNVMEIHAKGDELTVVFNGVVTAHARDGRFKQGPISLQFGNLPKAPGGPIKWRKVQIKEL